MDGGSISGFREACRGSFAICAGVCVLSLDTVIEISFFSNLRSNLDEVVWGAYDIMQKVDDSRSGWIVGVIRFL